MDVESNSFGHQEKASRSTTLLTQSSRKRSIEKVEGEQWVRFPSKRRRASSDISNENSIKSNNSKETPLVDPSRKRIIGDVEDAPPIISTPKRQRVLPECGSDVPASSPFDPPERSTPSPRLINYTRKIEQRMQCQTQHVWVMSLHHLKTHRLSSDQLTQ